MQKFGLQRSSRHTAVELEVAKEQASALGRAGRKLRLSLENYQTQLNLGVGERDKRLLLQEIADHVWALLLQREFVGFIEGNLQWIKANYVIPDDVLTLLGKH